MQESTIVAPAQRDDEAFTVTDLISAYEQGVEELRVAVAGMTGEQLRSRPVADKWSNTLPTHTANALAHQYRTAEAQKLLRLYRQWVAGSRTDVRPMPFPSCQCPASERSPVEPTVKSTSTAATQPRTLAGNPSPCSNEE
jgi:hypothetical protein